MAIQTRAAPAEALGESPHVVIVGGGISGLSAAWYLQRRAGAAGLDFRVTILEQAERWGGKIRSERIEGFGDEPFVMEAGADAFLTQKPWALELAEELGLTPRLLDTNDERRSVFVVRNGRLVALPAGVNLVAPTELRPFLASPLISWPGKLRMALDLVLPSRLDGQDESIAEFVSRRFGNEAVDRLAEPLMAGIYNAEADRQSVLATFPRFRETEAKYGSLIRGMRAARKAAQAAPRPKHAAFVSFRTGTEELVEALVGRLEADMRLGTGVEGITPDGSGYTLLLTGGERLYANHIILTTPAYAAASLLGDLAPYAAAGLRSIRHVSSLTLSLGFRRAEIDHPLDGFGVVIPPSEQQPINAITWTSTKFDHRAPDGFALIRVFFGGSRHPEQVDQVSEADLLATARMELKALMGIRAEPVVHRFFYSRLANPQYDVGHLALVDRIEAALPPGIHLAGSPYRGIGIPDCVWQARQAATCIVDTIRQSINA